MLMVAEEDREMIIEEINSRIRNDMATDADYEMLYLLDAPVLDY